MKLAEVHQDDWIRSVETALKQHIEQSSEESVQVTKEMIFESVRKKRNWSSPGEDKIKNFWMKRMNVFHQDIATAWNVIITKRLDIPSWLRSGRSVMVPKKDNPSASDFRPITCLNTLYKLITSVIDRFLQSHEERYHLRQIDQREGKAKTMGCVDNPLIDKMVLEDAHYQKKNLSCSWVDVKKAFDSVSHQWIIRTLEMRWIHNSLIHLIKSATAKTWRITLEVNTSNGKETIDPIKVNRGILQGDSFCIRLFTLALNPIAWYLRSTEGYTLSHASDRKITHLLFVDDFKSYHNSEQKAEVVSSKLKKIFKDIGLEWGINKCAVGNIKRGHLKTSGNNTMPTYDDDNIPLIGDHDHCKFLGKLQNTQHLDDKVTKEAAEEYEKRMWVIWTSPLSIPRKVKSYKHLHTTCTAVLYVDNRLVT